MFAECFEKCKAPYKHERYFGRMKEGEEMKKYSISYLTFNKHLFNIMRDLS